MSSRTSFSEPPGFIRGEVQTGGTGILGPPVGFPPHAVLPGGFAHANHLFLANLDLSSPTDQPRGASPLFLSGRR